jgi:integrating conjugative element protein (TIGR03759 family)
VPCLAWLEALLPRLADLSLGLDIYLLDAPSDEAVRRWAGAQRIPADWVRARRITLNHDAGLLAKLSHEARPPVLLRRQGAAVAPVTLLDLIAARAADAH